MNDKPIALKYPVENSQYIAGKIKDYQQKDNWKVKIMTNSSDSSKFWAMIKPDRSGNFVLQDDDKGGMAEIYYEVINNKNRRQAATIHFWQPNNDSVKFGTFTADTPPILSEQFLINNAVEKNTRFITQGVLLKSVDIKEQKLSPTDKLLRFHVKHFDAANARTFDLIDDPPIGSSFTVLDYLQGRVPGLQIVKTPVSNNTYSFLYQGPSTLTTSSDKLLPAFYIDESSVSMEDIVNMQLTDVALIQYIPPPVWFVPMNGGLIGAIMVYTKKSEDEHISGKPINSTFNRYKVNGYSVTREFAAPDYNKLNGNTSQDTRTTLFWQHDLNTDSAGNAQFRFYNSDRTKHYRIIVQGMNADGQIGYLEQVF